MQLNKYKREIVWKCERCKLLSVEITVVQEYNHRSRLITNELRITQMQLTTDATLSYLSL